MEDDVINTVASAETKESQDGMRLLHQKASLLHQTGQLEEFIQTALIILNPIRVCIQNTIGSLHLTTYYKILYSIIL